MDTVQHNSANEREPNQEDGMVPGDVGQEHGRDTETSQPEYTHHCPHRDILDNACELAGWIANIQPPKVSPEICNGCVRANPPMELNEITLALAGIKESDSGPGTTLHNLITWFIPQPENCGCPNRVQVMNAWGKERCLEELPTILGWLRESALDNNITYSEFVIAAVVKTVLRVS